MPEDAIEYEPFTVISVDPLVAYENKYYPQVKIFVNIILTQKKYT